MLTGNRMYANDDHPNNVFGKHGNGSRETSSHDAIIPRASTILKLVH